jgi:hypothetical protein
MKTVLTMKKTLYSCWAADYYLAWMTLRIALNHMSSSWVSDLVHSNEAMKTVSCL